MSQLVYTERELLEEDDYAAPQIEAGYKLHGGFDAEGRYVSPRTKIRWPAVRAWQEALAVRGWPLVGATTDLLQRDNYRNLEQQRLLLDHGLGHTLWNSLTTTGIIEARGRMLAEFQPPDFQAIVEEDISQTTTGHPAKGLFKAHGWDEGGVGDVGAHDAMRFAARDLLFGKDAYPIPDAPPAISRPESKRLMPLIPEPYEGVMMMVMNVLLIEVRAKAGFDFNVRIMRHPALFIDRRDEAERAAVLVDRIRQDEKIHVAYLQLVLSELRNFTFKTIDGGRSPGSAFIDPVWESLKFNHGATAYDQRCEQIRDGFLAAL